MRGLVSIGFYGNAPTLGIVPGDKVRHTTEKYITSQCRLYYPAYPDLELSILIGMNLLSIVFLAWVQHVGTGADGRERLRGRGACGVGPSR